MDNQILTVPSGYKEIDKKFCDITIKKFGLDMDDVNGVFLGKGELIITGTPKADDEEHNCDVLGCGSFSHVLVRKTL